MLVLLGLAEATVELPFGLAIGRDNDDPEPSASLVASALTDIRTAGAKQDERSIRTAVVLEAAMEQIAELEQRVADLEAPRLHRNRGTQGPGPRS